MGFNISEGIPVITVFLQGLISFFSPCVLPLIPLYMGYLSGGTKTKGEDGRVYFDKKKVMINTVFFVIGISFTFFLLGFGATILGGFFNSKQVLLARIGGAVIILFGLYQLGIFGTSKALSQEKRLSVKLDKMAMSPWTALIMGFTFSFAWTPCVGPVLSSVLLMTASANTKMWSFVLIGVYTLGFIIPFLAVGLFSTSLLEVFKKHGNIVKYTVKIGGILMIVIGIMMFTGKMNTFTGYVSGMSAESDVDSTSDKTEENIQSEEEEKEEEKQLVDAPNMVLKDQYGNVHNLIEDYKGKIIFLNFWATWCPPCKAEMPDIQKLHEKYSNENSDVVVLGVAAPGLGKEKSEEEIVTFLEENEYTYPVLLDEGGRYFNMLGIMSYPTTYMITEDGKIYGYVSGAISGDIMEDIINQTREGQKSN